MQNYTTELAPGGHWSLELRRGTQLTLRDLSGASNVGMLFYNPRNLLERYNAPDTLKCQHTFKLTQGHCLYSDMGRIFASITSDSFGWHDTVCGNSHASHIAEKWGARDYQTDRNDWHQNGYDAFLVELAKYGLGAADMAANLNWFSKVMTDAEGNMALAPSGSNIGDTVTLRFEMDTLVLLHSCPHPYSKAETYPKHRIGIELDLAAAVAEDDECLNHCPENARGFANNALYYLGA
ncbi:urea amidolyase associated protein UAAP1 [Zhongshania aliphaticivorans]|uniref:Urea carboxylase n=1 Tax=Zhongshania aliphaticivorans TaxID=1470434 RepID=A0A127M7V2_9GAMM|nr:urea amidolyase associated protein UAAP1 [Zhongshania aliphaticivorans]AMO69281.1 urea carboxylase [Zhongshania aliphaticivorans]|tara:strand:- start:19200 stop:19910 length:711 start_codon:yes stop_codon:yes gene_type:complete